MQFKFQARRAEQKLQAPSFDIQRNSKIQIPNFENFETRRNFELRNSNLEQEPELPKFEPCPKLKVAQIFNLLYRRISFC